MMTSRRDVIKGASGVATTAGVKAKTMFTFLGWQTSVTNCMHFSFYLLFQIYVLSYSLSNIRSLSLSRPLAVCAPLF